jgi:hypothetical protein
MISVSVRAPYKRDTHCATASQTSGRETAKISVCAPIFARTISRAIAIVFSLSSAHFACANAPPSARPFAPHERARPRVSPNCSTRPIGGRPGPPGKINAIDYRTIGAADMPHAGEAAHGASPRPDAPVAQSLFAGPCEGAGGRSQPWRPQIALARWKPPMAFPEGRTARALDAARFEAHDQI